MKKAGTRSAERLDNVDFLRQGGSPYTQASSLRVDLSGTSLSNLPEPRVREERNEKEGGTDDTYLGVCPCSRRCQARTRIIVTHVMEGR
jgi:hypothetical protein